jgi:ABC-2 type transport system permease protein
MSFFALGPVLFDMAFGRGERSHSTADVLASLASGIEFVIPLAALLFGHLAIVGARERGSLRTLLAYPVSRRNVVLGTLLGRTAVVGATLAGGLAVAFVAGWLFIDGLDLLPYAAFSAATIAFGVIFVAIAVGISAGSRRRGSALAWTMTIFVVTWFLWDLLLLLARALADVSVVTSSVGPDEAPGWYVFLDRIHPGTAWRNLVTAWIAPVLPDGGVGESPDEPVLTTSGPEPFYLDEWTMVVVLLAWGLVPLLVGYWRFRNAEIA